MEEKKSKRDKTKNVGRADSHSFFAPLLFYKEEMEREGERGATKAKESEPKEKREMIMDEDRKDGE